MKTINSRFDMRNEALGARIWDLSDITNGKTMIQCETITGFGSVKFPSINTSGAGSNAVLNSLKGNN